MEIPFVNLHPYTYREYSVEVHRILKDVANRRTQKYRVTCSAAEKAGLITREAGALRREMAFGDLPRHDVVSDSSMPRVAGGCTPESN